MLWNILFIGHMHASPFARLKDRSHRVWSRAVRTGVGVNVVTDFNEFHYKGYARIRCNRTHWNQWRRFSHHTRVSPRVPIPLRSAFCMNGTWQCPWRLYKSFSIVPPLLLADSGTCDCTASVQLLLFQSAWVNWPWKRGDWKCTIWKWRTKSHGMKMTDHRSPGAWKCKKWKCKTWNWRIWKRRTKLLDMKMQDPKMEDLKLQDYFVLGFTAKFSRSNFRLTRPLCSHMTELKLDLKHHNYEMKHLLTRSALRRSRRLSVIIITIYRPRV